MQPKNTKLGGRGAPNNPAGRFEKFACLHETEASEDNRPATSIFRDTSKTIISTNDSPDVGIEASVNPYRGCEHGCIYCYARPTHEYLGLSAGLDFETKIFAKFDAPRLLREKLSSKSWIPKTITLSGVTDPYQPLERKLKITRGCLEVLAEFRNPAFFITKNQLITRDLDLLAELAHFQAAGAFISITTLDSGLARIMEPRASQPALRLRAVEELARAGIPVGVMIGPVLPGLTEYEIPNILESAAQAGAITASYTMLRLPYGVKDLFQDWLTQHYPDRKDKIINRIKEMRGGKLNASEFGERMRGIGHHAGQIDQLFNLHKKKFGLDKRLPPLSIASFRRVKDGKQGELF
ncbi:MAG: PA0069 family radical SAM protein [Dongiaceae bacterium]